MTASPRRWDGRRFFIFTGRLEAQLWARDGCRLVGLLVKSFGFVVLVFFLPPLAAGFAFCSRVARVGGGRAGLSGGRQTRAGRCGLRDATGRGRGRHCCRGLALAMSLAGGKQRSGRGDGTRDPPPIACTHGWPRGPGECASAGCFQIRSGEVRGNGAHGTCRCSVGPRCPAGGCSGTVCVWALLPPPLPTVPHTCPTPRGFGLRCCWGTCRGQFGDRWVPGRAGFAGQWGDQLPGVTQS